MPDWMKQYIYYGLFSIAALVGTAYILATTGCATKTNEWHVTNSDIYVDGTGIQIEKGDDNVSNEPDIDAEASATGLCDECHGAWLGELTQEDIEDIVKPAPPKPSPPKPTPPKPEPEYSDKYHHYNSNAWHGAGGVALVLCPDSPRFKSCKIDGVPLTRHPAQDKGRDVWTIYRKARGLGGVITCKSGNQTVTFKVRGGGGMEYGKCK